MNTNKVRAVKAQCVKVAQLCDETLARVEADRAETNAHLRSIGAEVSPASTLIGPSRQSGALRRASMELTRALADLRKPG